MIRSGRAEPRSEVAYVLVTLTGVYSQVLFWPFLAAQMDRQADDETDNPLFPGQLLEPLRIRLRRPAVVILIRPSDAHLQIGHRHPNPHRAIINTRNPPTNGSLLLFRFLESL